MAISLAFAIYNFNQGSARQQFIFTHHPPSTSHYYPTCLSTFFYFHFPHNMAHIHMSGLLQDYPLRYCYYYCSYDDDDTAAYYERPYIYLFFFGTSRTLTEIAAYRKLRPMYNSFWILDSRVNSQ